jgi:hypothetical protein
MSQEVDLSSVLSTIESSSKHLNSVSNNSNAVLRNIEKRLTGANIGLEVWWDKKTLDHIGSTDLRHDETACWRTQQLGFTRIGGDWCLAVRTMRNGAYYFEGDENVRQAVDGEPTALLRAPRNIRLEALRLMPEFLVFLQKVIEETAGNLETATASLTQAKK